MSKDKAGVLGLLIGGPVGAIGSFLFAIATPDQMNGIQFGADRLLGGVVIGALLGFAAGSYLGKRE